MHTRMVVSSKPCIALFTFRKRARSFCNMVGVRPRANHKPGAHLEYSDPQLEQVRSYVRNEAVIKHGCHERLIANFDQVWTTLYKPQQRPLGRSTQTTVGPDKTKFIKTVRHQVERMLDMEFTEQDPRTTQKTEPRTQQVTGGAAALGCVENWRQPRSLTTLSWIDGTVSRGYVTYRKGTIPEKAKEWVGQHLSKWLVLGEELPNTHIWNESTFISYLSFLAVELRYRRKQLGLTAHDKALIICDQAGAHMSRTYRALQINWCTEHNVESCLQL